MLLLTTKPCSVALGLTLAVLLGCLTEKTRTMHLSSSALADITDRAAEDKSKEYRKELFADITTQSGLALDHLPDVYHFGFSGIWVLYFITSCQG